MEVIGLKCLHHLVVRPKIMIKVNFTVYFVKLRPTIEPLNALIICVTIVVSEVNRCVLVPV